MFLGLQGVLGICWLRVMMIKWKLTNLRRAGAALSWVSALFGCWCCWVVSTAVILHTHSHFSHSCPSSHPLLDPVLQLIGTCPNKHPSLSDRWIQAYLDGTSFPWGTSFLLRFTDLLCDFYLVRIIKFFSHNTTPQKEQYINCRDCNTVWITTWSNGHFMLRVVNLM